MSRECLCGKKRWLDKSFLQILKCLKVTGWLTKKELILSDHMIRNPRPEPDFVLQTAGSHPPLGALFLITRRLSPSCFTSNTSPGFSCLTVEARHVCGGSNYNWSMWVQEKHFPLGPTAWLLSTSPSPGSLWELLWFLPEAHQQLPWVRSRCGEAAISSGTHCLRAFLTRILNPFGKEFAKFTFGWDFWSKKNLSGLKHSN